MKPDSGIFVPWPCSPLSSSSKCSAASEHFRRGNHVNALFNNVQDLKVGDRVKMAGVEIGRVEDIQLDETNKVRVTMKVQHRRAR